MISLKKLNFICCIGLLVGLFLSSCKKDEDKQIPPDISFKTGAGYVSTNTILHTNDTILVGINAAKTEDKDLLVHFVATQQYDTNPATTIFNESFNEDTYSKDMTIITRKTTGIETYTYTIINRDGLTKTISLVLTVN